jgi:ABC-type lipoprotein release transport system permease subunit
MKNLAIFSIFFLASFAIGATPILIGVALVYAVAWFLSRNAETSPPPAPPAAAPPPPPFGNISRKFHL